MSRTVDKRPIWDVGRFRFHDAKAPSREDVQEAYKQWQQASETAGKSNAGSAEQRHADMMGYQYRKLLQEWKSSTSDAETKHDPSNGKFSGGGSSEKGGEYSHEEHQKAAQELNNRSRAARAAKQVSSKGKDRQTVDATLDRLLKK